MKYKIMDQWKCGFRGAFTTCQCFLFVHKYIDIFRGYICLNGCATFHSGVPYAHWWKRFIWQFYKKYTFISDLLIYTDWLMIYYHLSSWYISTLTTNFHKGEINVQNQPFCSQTRIGIVIMENVSLISNCKKTTCKGFNEILFSRQRIGCQADKINFQ